MSKEVENESVQTSTNELTSYNRAYREKLLQDELQEVKHKYLQSLKNFNSNTLSTKLDKFGNDLFFVRMYDILDSLYCKYNSKVCCQMDYKEVETQLQNLMCECLNFIIETYDGVDNTQRTIKLLKESMGRY